MSEAETIARDIAAKYIYGAEDEILEQKIVQLLTERGQTLALAESCTGGYLGHRITNVSGASAVLLAGVVPTPAVSLLVREEDAVVGERVV